MDHNDTTEFEDYTDFVLQGMSEHVTSNPGIHLAWAALGLAAETGEMVEIIEKGIRKNTLYPNIEYGNLSISENTRYKIMDEAGDVLWYLTAFCALAGVSMDEVMEYNIQKLNERYYEKVKSLDEAA